MFDTSWAQSSHPAQLIRFKRTKFLYPTPLNGINYTSGKRGSFIFVDTRKKLSEMNFNSIQELSLYVSLSISERSFRFRISITIFFSWIHPLSQLISSAFQRCRVSEDLCRLSVILRVSAASDPHTIHISSKFRCLRFEFSFRFPWIEDFLYWTQISVGFDSSSIGYGDRKLFGGVSGLEDFHASFRIWRLG